MNVVKEIQRINQLELEQGIGDEASWHQKYKDSAYVFVGGLDYELTEGDVITIMSQYGEIVDCNLVRDKEKGKSKGFAFVAFEDQRSTVLAVDNMNGSKLFDRTIRCDHVLEYRKPRKKKKDDDEDEKEQGGYESDETYEQRRKRIWDYEAYNKAAAPMQVAKVAKQAEESSADKKRQSKIMAILEQKKRKWKERRMMQAEEDKGYSATGTGKKIWGGQDMMMQLNQRDKRDRSRNRSRDRSPRKDKKKKDKKKKKEKDRKKEKKRKKSKRDDGGRRKRSRSDSR